MAVVPAGTPSRSRSRRDRRRRHPTLGRFVAVGALALLGLIASTVALGLDPVAIAAAATVFAAASAMFAAVLHARHRPARLGWANVVTTVRMTLVALLLSVLFSGRELPLFIVAVGTTALVLDGVDGLLARRQGTASDFGAAFDMEVDAAFGLVLALLATQGPAGPIALVLGLPRYLFGAATLLAPWLGAPLGDRFSRKVVCVVQLVGLLLLQLPILPAPVAVGVVAVVAIALIWSFGSDVRMLRRKRTGR